MKLSVISVISKLRVILLDMDGLMVLCANIDNPDLISSNSNFILMMMLIDPDCARFFLWCD